MIQSEEKTIILRVIENFIRAGEASDRQVSVVILPPGKTSFVETIGEDGRSIMLDEYAVDGKGIWAGYSSRSKTAYLSLKNA